MIYNRNSIRIRNRSNIENFNPLVLNVASTSASAWKTTAIFSENNNLVESISLIEVKSKFAPKFTSAKHISSKVVIKPPLQYRVPL
jgi:hypothetical protein